MPGIPAGSYQEVGRRIRDRHGAVSAAAPAVRVGVGEPVAMLRTGVCSLLAGNRFDVVGAGDLAGLLEAAGQASLDVALVDLDLPAFGGIRATQCLVRAFGCRVVVWSAAPSRRDALAAIKAGAWGFLDKHIGADGLVRAVAGVLRGEAAIGRDLVATIIEELHHDAGNGAPSGLHRLSSRELEVLALVAEGLGNREIANALAISEFTVKRHMQNILQKLAVHSRTAAVALYESSARAERAPA